jgi:lipid II:glycine glycyltransferase (peptidoglycan interpeptide bridge formation enzyme)
VLQWAASRDAKKRGMQVYNFWGIAPENNPNHPWRGITLFKKGFGGRNIEYIHAQDLAVSPLYIIPRTIEMVRRVVKGYD